MEPMLDPANDRVVKTLPCPPARPLTIDVLYGGGAKIPDISILKSHLLLEGKLAKDTMVKLQKQATSLFTSEPNLLRIAEPIVLVGDIHG